MVFYLAFGVKHKFSQFGKKGEYSYGMYLWGFPVGQTLCMVSGNHMNWFVNAVLTSIIAILLGILNYYVVDRTVNKFQK
jgi:peptidoglycan/LPS O-acetylase OafA/YrhL